MHISVFIKRRKILATGLSLSLIALIGVLTVRQSAQKSDETGDEPTRIQRGVITERQREHSKLYKNDSLGRKVTSHEEPEITIYIGPGAFGRAGSDPSTPEIRMHQNVCNVDIVILGSVSSKVSQLTTEEDYIFTDYTISVLDILKNDPASSVQKSDIILLSRPGGSVQFDGKTVSVVNRDELPLKAATKYLLFLSRIPATGVYVAKAGSLSLGSGGENKVLSQQFRTSDFVGKSTTDILEAVRTAATNGCSKDN